VEGEAPIELERVAAELGAIGFLAGKQAKAADDLVCGLRADGGDGADAAADVACVLWQVADAAQFVVSLLAESGELRDTRLGGRNVVALAAMALEGRGG